MLTSWVLILALFPALLIKVVRAANKEPTDRLTSSKTPKTPESLVGAELLLAGLTSPQNSAPVATESLLGGLTGPLNPAPLAAESLLTGFAGPLSSAPLVAESLLGGLAGPLSSAPQIHDPSIIPLAHEAINTLVQQKVAESFVMDPWERVPKLPDHEVMVGVPQSGTAPAMHMDVAGVPMGVQDILLDTVGSAITQTFFGKRNVDIDDDDWNDEYDREDADDKNNSDDDDDDDKDDTRSHDDDRKEQLKAWLRPKFAPLTLTMSNRIPHRTVSRPAALLHRPIMSARSPVGQLTALHSRSGSSSNGLIQSSQLRLLAPQAASPGVMRSGSHLSNYRIASASGFPRPNNGLNRNMFLNRPLRVLYD